MKIERKIERINALIERLEVGDSVSLRSIDRLLTAEQMLTLKRDLSIEGRSRKHQKPKEIKTYETLLRRGLLLYGQYEATHHQLTAYKSKKLIEQAQSEMEKATQYACEIVGADSSLRIWFDRDLGDVDFGAPEGMPRVVTSKSYDNICRGENLPFTNTKREIKMAALASALNDYKGNDLEAWTGTPSEWQRSPIRHLSVNFSDWKF